MIKTQMIKTTSRLTVMAAAAGMAFAPIAAQANTRAADNAPVFAAQATAQPGTSRDDDDGEGLVGLPSVFAALFAAAAAAGATVVVTDAGDEDDLDQSPGT